MALVEKDPNLEMLYVDLEGKTYVSSGLKDIYTPEK